MAQPDAFASARITAPNPTPANLPDSSDAFASAKIASPQPSAPTPSNDAFASAKATTPPPQPAMPLAPVSTPREAVGVRPYQQIMSFASRYNFAPPSSNPNSPYIMGGIHAGPNDPHFRGEAVDLRTKGHTSDQIDQFIKSAIQNGYSVEDARNDPDQPHVHVQAGPFQGGARYITHNTVPMAGMSAARLALGNAERQYGVGSKQATAARQHLTQVAAQLRGQSPTAQGPAVSNPLRGQAPSGSILPGADLRGVLSRESYPDAVGRSEDVESNQPLGYVPTGPEAAKAFETLSQPSLLTQATQELSKVADPLAEANARLASAIIPTPTAQVQKSVDALTNAGHPVLAKIFSTLAGASDPVMGYVRGILESPGAAAKMAASLPEMARAYIAPDRQEVIAQMGGQKSATTGTGQFLSSLNPLAPIINAIQHPGDPHATEQVGQLVGMIGMGEAIAKARGTVLNPEAPVHDAIRTVAEASPAEIKTAAENVVQTVKPHFRVTAEGKILPKETPSAPEVPQNQSLGNEGREVQTGSGADRGGNVQQGKEAGPEAGHTQQQVSPQPVKTFTDAHTSAEPIFYRVSTGAEFESANPRSHTKFKFGNDPEDGLSVSPLLPDEKVPQQIGPDLAFPDLPKDAPANIGANLANYGHMILDNPNNHIWAVKGDAVGFGADGEPVLNNVQKVGEIDKLDAYRYIEAWAKEYAARHNNPELLRKIQAQGEEINGNLTRQSQPGGETVQPGSETQVVPVPNAGPRPNTEILANPQGGENPARQAAPGKTGQAARPEGPGRPEGGPGGNNPIPGPETRQGGLEEPQFVGSTHADTTAIREKLGWPERTPDGTSIPAMIDKAKAEGTDRSALSIAQEVLDNPRPLTDSEQIAIGVRLAELDGQLPKLRYNEVASQGSPEYSLHEQALTDAENEMRKLVEASDKAGTEWGRSGLARQIQIAQDFSESGMYRKLYKAKGSVPPTAEEMAAGRAKAPDIQKLEQMSQEAGKKPPDIKPNPAKGVKTTRTSVLAGNKVFTQERLQGAMRDLLGAPLGSGAEGVAKLGKALYTVAGAYAEAGFRHFGRFMVQLRSDHPDVAAKASIEDWKAAHDKAKADIDKQLGVIPREQPAAVRNVMQELSAAKDAQRRNLGAANAQDRAIEAAEKRQRVAQAEAMARKDAEVLMARRQQAKAGLREGFNQQKSDVRSDEATQRSARLTEQAINKARQDAIDRETARITKQRRNEITEAFRADQARQRANQKAYDQEYKQRANDAESLDRENQAFHEMNTTGADPKDLAHQGAMERFVARLLDQGATPEDVINQVKARTPNADPYAVAQLLDKAAGSYRSRFSGNPTIAENYIQKGKYALFGDDAGKLKAELEKQKAAFSNYAEGLRQRTLSEHAARYLSENVISGLGFASKIASSGTAGLISEPLESLATPVLRKIKIGGQSIAERAPSEAMTPQGLAAKALGTVKEAGRTIFKPRSSQATEFLRTGLNEPTIASGQTRGAPIGFGRLHGAMQSIFMQGDFEGALANEKVQALNKGANWNDPDVQAAARKRAGDLAIERAMRGPNATADYGGMVHRLLASNDPSKQAAGLMFHTVTPVRNLPANYLVKTADYMGGAPIRAGLLIRATLADARKGIPMSDVRAASIAQAVKRTVPAAAIVSIGLTNPSWLRSAGLGTYKKGQSIMGKDGTPLKPGESELNLPGMPSLRFRGHNPLSNALAGIATIRDLHAGRMEWSKAAQGAAREVPGVPGITSLGEGNTTPLVGEVTPAGTLTRSIAQKLDTDAKGNPVKRQQKNPVQQVEAEIPFLRNTLPLAGKSPSGPPVKSIIPSLVPRQRSVGVHLIGKNKT